MKHSPSKIVLGVGIVTAIILSLSTHTFAIIGDTGKPLADIETILQRIETNKIVQSNDEGFDKLFDVFMEGVRRERSAAKGDKKKLGELQNALKRHEGQLRAIETRLKNMEGRIKGGDVKLSRGILQTMNETELDEFKRFLAPDALNQYEKLHPDIFKPKVTPPKTPKKVMKQDILDDENISLVQDFLKSLSDHFVTPAYATDCGRVCDDSVSSCQQSCCRCKWYKFWCCIARAACTLNWITCYLACLIAG